MSIISIEGDPVASIEFLGLPSVNTHYGKHWRARGPITGEWRYEARAKAYEYTLWLDKPLVDRAFVVVNVWPPFEEISDIHNVHIKPILDGFSDAEVWVDDEWAFVPIVMYAWAGIGHHKPRAYKVRKTVIDIYQLDAYVLNGDRQLLPKGRKKLYDEFEWEFPKKKQGSPK